MHESITARALRRPGAALLSLLTGAMAPAGCYTGLPRAVGDGDGDDGADVGDASAEAGSDAGSSSGGEPPDGELSPPPSVGWQRLSAVQYRNTITDLVGYAAADPDVAAEVIAGLQSVFAVIPHDDGGVDGYASFDQRVLQPHVDAYFEAAFLLGVEMTATPARISAFAGSCATDQDTTNDAGCIDEFVANFGRLSARRPLSDAELSFFRESAYASGDAVGAGALSELIAVMVSAPSFLYRVELGSDAWEEGSPTQALSDHEIAARCSYLLWNSMPDPTLFAAADDGTLSTPDGRAAQIARMFDDPRAKASLTGFFHTWLELERIPDLAAATADAGFAAMAGDPLPSDALAGAMVEDVLDSARYYGWEVDASLREWFAAPASFARSEELATIYGVPVWDGTGEPPLADARAGLLTRPALLAHATALTHPIRRGRLVRERILCDILPPPPPDAQGSAPAPLPDDGAREWAERITSEAGCAGCHAMTNPLGFALERFDSLGRYRDTEPVFDEQGNLITTQPIDASALPNLDAASTEVDGAIELTQLLLSTGRLESCFARQFFEYAHGRRPDLTTTDAALIDHLTAVGIDEEPMGEVMRAMPIDARFFHRGWEGL